MKNLVCIPKEQLAGVRFAQVEVLPQMEEIKMRERNLLKALILGNLEHQKVKLFICDEQLNFLLVETTIWAVTDSGVCLKGGLNVPKQAIVQVEI
ncbi:hypothetical protein GCM10028791_08490 [Echinicola sediminis]